MEEQKAVLLTGSNLGDRHENLDRARKAVAEQCGRILALSDIRESEPWGDVRGVDGGQAPRFLNQALVVSTHLGPLGLLEAVKSIEKRMGRTENPVDKGADEGRSYSSRIIDIDIIFYGERILDLPRLKIPHPMMERRRFVLEPLAQVAPQWRHPVSGLTAAQMLQLCG